jgi:outer membrane immunogenic protein
LGDAVKTTGLLTTILAAVTMSGAALAADMPLKAPAPIAVASGWGGFYLGGGIGARGTTDDSTVTNSQINGVTGFPFGPVGALFCAQQGGCIFGTPLDQVAFRGTVYGGYNWQVTPSWVLGLEGDVGFADRTRTLLGMNYPMTGNQIGGTGNSILGISNNPADSYALRTTWDASIRARLGWVVNPSVMLYATGGATWLHFSTISTCNSGPTIGFCTQGAVVPVIGAPGFSPAVVTNNNTRLGWTVGGGLEAKLTSNWVARGEYRYSDYGTTTLVDTRASTSAAAGFPVGTTSRVTHDEKINTHTATIGISYLFNAGPVVAKY